MYKTNEIKLTRQTSNGQTGLYSDGYEYPFSDIYLKILMDFLREHGINTHVLEILKGNGELGMGGDSIYFAVKDFVIVIYDYYANEFPENGIKIDRNALIQIIKAWQGIIQKSSSSEFDLYRNINQISFKRDRECIEIAVQFKDGTEFSKSFNYRWQEKPYHKTGGHYIDTLQAFLYEHRWRSNEILHILNAEARVDFGVNTMYMKVDESEVTIYNYFDEQPEKNAIKIKKNLLVKLFQAIAKNKYAVVENIILTKDNNRLNIVIQYEENIPDLHETFSL